MKTWMFIIIFIVLLVGFIVMSLILVQGLDFLRQITKSFIELIRNLVL